MKTRAKFGDIMEVLTPRGMAYFQYMSQNKDYGDLIKILPGIFAERPKRFEELAKKEGIFVFYPATLATKRKKASIVATMPISAEDKRRKIFRTNSMSNNGHVVTEIVTADGESYLTESVDLEEKQLPDTELWNHKMLIHQIISGGRPEKKF